LVASLAELLGDTGRIHLDPLVDFLTHAIIAFLVAVFELAVVFVDSEADALFAFVVDAVDAVFDDGPAHPVVLIGVEEHVDAILVPEAVFPAGVDLLVLVFVHLVDVLLLPHDCSLAPIALVLRGQEARLERPGRLRARGFSLVAIDCDRCFDQEFRVVD